MNDYLNGLTGGGFYGPSPTQGINLAGGPISSGASAAGAPTSGPTFWQNLAAAMMRGQDAGGGVQGLAAALSPTYAAAQPYRGNTNLQSSQGGQNIAGGNSATSGNAQSAQAASGAMSKLGGLGAAAGL